MKKRSEISGFTLIEVLVSMMVMAVSLTVIMGLFSGGLRSKARANESNTAVELARTKMEEVLLKDFMETGSDEGDFGNGYLWEVEILDTSQDGSQENLKKLNNMVLYAITIQIKWKTGEQEKKYSVSTVQARKKRKL